MLLVDIGCCYVNIKFCFGRLLMKERLRDIGIFRDFYLVLSII